jgi:hypothetical protein
MMNISATICPNCKTENELGATLCKQCGASLQDTSLEAGLKTRTTDMQALTPEMIEEWSLKEAKELSVPDTGIAFYVDGHSMPAYIDSQPEFVLGRKVGTTSERLLDLAPFGGYSLGLSRRHATIRKTEDGYELMDLGSVNGTWLNEERLMPHTAYALPSGSNLRLGRMRLLVLYRPFEVPK